MIDIPAIPKKPGVYLFKDKDGTILYVGKAKNLKARVSSYFSRSKEHSVKTLHLVGKIDDAEFFIVDNEIEALLLENQLIKKHKPKYNIALKDAKTFAYILITEEEYPKILSTRRVGRKGHYFGPFTDGSLRLELIKLVVSLFKLRTCRNLPKKPCLNFFIGTCTAPCDKHVSKHEYQKQVSDAVSFLKGHTAPVVLRLKEEMRTAAKDLHFEAALKFRKQIEAVDHLQERQKVERVVRFDQSVVALQPVGAKAIIEVFTIVRGVLSGKKEFSFEYEDSILAHFIKLYYSTIPIPSEIIVSHAFWESEHEKKVLEGYLTKLKGSKVFLTYPYRGEKRALVEMAMMNIQESASPVVLEEIKERLHLPSIPLVIECFDISNLSYDHVVGAMVQFVNAKPNTMGYRRFAIKSFTGANDFAAMHEVVLRRYTRLSKERSQLPDLIILDGGRQQLDAALRALRSIGLVIPAIGLAKKREEIYVPGLSFPLSIPKDTPMMLLLRQIRDAVHRFALSYNKKKRQMRMREEFSG